jgi:DNA-binding response OmpR family regulator
MKVLLVDDEEKFISRLAERLSIRGMETDWVTSSEDALLKALEKSYDVAILDVKMPHIGGIELKKKLEKMDPEMKFIMVTGHGSENDYNIGSREASFYIIKPFKIDTLVDKIKQTQAPRH